MTVNPKPTPPRVDVQALARILAHLMKHELKRERERMGRSQNQRDVK